MEHEHAQTWDFETDVVVVGSGAGGLCAALSVNASGHESLVIEKGSTLGGASVVSGGVIWVPNNRFMRECGVVDDEESGYTYMRSLIKTSGLATSEPRIRAFLHWGPETLDFVASEGVALQPCLGYSDYEDDQPGGVPLGRAVEPRVTNERSLGAWRSRLPRQRGVMRLAIQAADVPDLSRVGRTWNSLATGWRVVARSVGWRLLGRRPVAAGRALVTGLLSAYLARGGKLWLEATMKDIIVRDGRAVGLLVDHEGRSVRVKARYGVILAAGGFAKNRDLRQRFQRGPISTEWTSVPEGDTGDALEAAMPFGVLTEALDDAWWMPSTVLPDGRPQFLIAERAKPHCLIVDSSGRRYFNEAQSYARTGQEMYRHHQEVACIPSWFIMDAQHRARYSWGTHLPRHTPKEWLESGYFTKADSIDELARRIDVDPDELRKTVERFNYLASRGKDEDFGKGERAYDRWYGDPRVRPNPCLGMVSKAPFYAVKVYPGDVGTAGGLVTDERGRVLTSEDQVIPGLYACGTSSASVMGYTYPGPGATIAPAIVFGRIAALDALAAAPK